ncbi:MAG: EamA family transporter [Flammeovirgaceae bacterium]|nr:EamA family transporter [Flammeovirgaceae bacterium]
MKQQTKDILFLHFIVLIWGFTAVIGLLIDLTPVEIVFYRTGMAAFLLVIILFSLKRSFVLSSRGSLLKTSIVGFLLAAHWVLFFLSAKISTAAVCLVGMATTSFWTSIIEPLFFKKQIQVFEIFLSLLAVVGILIVFNMEIEYFLGLFFAIVAAILAALFSIINVLLVKKEDHFVITFYEMVFACIFTGITLPFYLVYVSHEMFEWPTLEEVIWLLILASVCTVFAVSYSVKLMKRLSAFFVNLTINLEPIYGIILALLVFGDSEKMSLGFYLGTGLILCSVLLYPLLNRKRKRKALETDILR